MLLTACGPKRVIIVAQTRTSLDAVRFDECERACASALRDGEKVVRCGMAELDRSLLERFKDLQDYAVTCELE
jgi:hypothetical protein